MMATERKKITPELSRARQLVKRSAFDLKLAAEAARAAQLPSADLMKLSRARREVGDLLSTLGAASERRTHGNCSEACCRGRVEF